MNDVDTCRPGIFRRFRAWFRPRRRIEPGGPGWGLPPGAGVREARRPYPFAGSGAVAIDEPDVRA
jgi:hypothetical protein